MLTTNVSKVKESQCVKCCNFTRFPGLKILWKGIARNCASPQNFYTRKFCEITVFCRISVLASITFILNVLSENGIIFVWMNYLCLKIKKNVYFTKTYFFKWGFVHMRKYTWKYYVTSVCCMVQYILIQLQKSYNTLKVK